MIECHIKCGKCCYPVIMDKDFVHSHKDKFQREICKKLPVLYNNILPVTFDMKCVFLKEDCTCAVYEDRPDVCKDYICDGSDKVSTMTCIARSRFTPKDSDISCRIGVYVEYCDKKKAYEEDDWFLNVLEMD